MARKLLFTKRIKAIMGEGIDARLVEAVLLKEHEAPEGLSPIAFVHEVREAADMVRGHPVIAKAYAELYDLEKP